MDDPHTGNDMGGGASLEGLGELLVRAADKLLDADRCSLLVDAGSHFDIVVTTAEGEIPHSVPRGMDIRSQSYETGIPCVIDDCSDTRSAAADQSFDTNNLPEVRSLCCIPIEGVGLLVAEAYRPGAFNESEKEHLVRLVEELFSDAEEMRTSETRMGDGGYRIEGAPERLEHIADILSHDLVTPLNVISGNIELAIETGEERHLHEALNAVERTREILDEVVVLARTGGFVDEPELVDLKEATDTALTNVESSEATVEVVDSASIEADRRALCHLLENVLNNAVEHAGSDVTIRIGSTDHGFYIEDDGPGIPPDDRHRVFARGYTQGKETTGLGLHIVRQIATAHGWEVWVEESSLGGARFVFTDVKVV